MTIISVQRMQEVLLSVSHIKMPTILFKWVEDNEKVLYVLAKEFLIQGVSLRQKVCKSPFLFPFNLKVSAKNIENIVKEFEDCINFRCWHLYITLFLGRPPKLAGLDLELIFFTVLFYDVNKRIMNLGNKVIVTIAENTTTAFLHTPSHPFSSGSPLGHFGETPGDMPYIIIYLMR